MAIDLVRIDLVKGSRVPLLAPATITSLNVSQKFFALH